MAIRELTTEEIAEVSGGNPASALVGRAITFAAGSVAGGIIYDVLKAGVTSINVGAVTDSMDHKLRINQRHMG